jgi:hypothetical protein
VITELVDSRAIAALRFLDAETGQLVEAPLSVSSPGSSFVRNHRGFYVITAAPGFGAYTEAFPAPPAVASATLSVVVADPQGRYLPRRVSVSIPRPLDAGAGSLGFVPVDVTLYPSPSAPVAAGSAVLRASVTDAATGRGLAGALLRVVSGSSVLARGLTDTRGEALVPVAGIRVTSWSGGSGNVLLNEIDADVTAAFDPASAGASGPVPDPDALEAALAGLRTATASIKLASRREKAIPLPIALA